MIGKAEAGVRKKMATLQVLLLGFLTAIVRSSPAPQNFGIKSSIGGSNLHLKYWQPFVGGKKTCKFLTKSPKINTNSLQN